MAKNKGYSTKYVPDSQVGPKKTAKKQKGRLFGKPRGSVVKHPGAFSAKAKAAGMSTSAYAEKVSKSDTASPQTKKQAGLAKAFATMRSKKKKKKG